MHRHGNVGAYENLDEGDDTDGDNHENIEVVGDDRGFLERVQPVLDEELESEEDDFAELDTQFDFQNIRAATPPTSSESSSSESSSSSSSSSSTSSLTDDNHNQQAQGRFSSHEAEDENEDEDAYESQDEDAEAQAYVAEFFEGYQLEDLLDGTGNNSTFFFFKKNSLRILAIIWSLKNTIQISQLLRSST